MHHTRQPDKNHETEVVLLWGLWRRLRFRRGLNYNICTVCLPIQAEGTMAQYSYVEFFVMVVLVKNKVNSAICLLLRKSTSALYSIVLSNYAQREDQYQKSKRRFKGRRHGLKDFLPQCDVPLPNRKCYSKTGNVIRRGFERSKA